MYSLCLYKICSLHSQDMPLLWQDMLADARKICPIGRRKSQHMKINISDNVIMSAALGKVEEGEYFDALCLFARVNSYESMLNQIGCLSELHDVGYAVDLYRKLLSKYAFTHNCYTDARRLGEATEIVMSYFGNEPKGEFAVEDDGKYTADEQLLGFYPVDFDENIFDPDDMDLEYFIDAFGEGEETHKSIFFDVKSPEYFQDLKRRMGKAYMDGNIAKGRALQREFMELNTDDVSTIETQLFICFTEQQWDKGAEYALRIVNHDGATYHGLGFAAQILARVEGYNEQLQHALLRLSEYGEVVSDLEMMDYVQIAASKLGYGELTLKLTDILYSHYKDAGCFALKLCARVYFNCFEYEKAREALLMLLRAVPWDAVAQTLLAYFNRGLTLLLDDPSGYNNLARYFDVPNQLSVVAQYTLLTAIENNASVLGADSYFYIECLLRLCSSYIVKGDGERFANVGAILNAIVDNCVPSDVEAFFDFAKECLLHVLPEPSVSKAFLAKLIQLGYDGKLLVSLTRGYYTLNLSRVKERSEQPFVDSFSIAATLRKVDAVRIERAYKSLKAAVDIPVECNTDTVRQIAYALLAISYKGFAESEESSYFADEERELYLQYLSVVGK